MAYGIHRRLAIGLREFTLPDGDDVAPLRRGRPRSLAQFSGAGLSNWVAGKSDFSEDHNKVIAHLLSIPRKSGRI